MPPKKLIEVALPLEAINKESAREKSIRHGHPSTLHLWWARRPLAACRAVLFASLVDDPGSRPDLYPTEAEQEAERQRLFELIEQLVKWENVTNETVLNAARAEILRATGGNPPSVLDPFAGGGSIPLEAQRLGLEAHASDLNPVAVLINKALIEIPPKFAGQPPVNPAARAKLAHQSTWKGAAGLAEDVRYYGQWMRDEAERRIGHLYPKVTLPKEQGGGEATVIAWLWARTVPCPNPACGARMPLVRSFALSTKKGKEAWVEPSISRDQQPPTIRFEVKMGQGKAPEGTVGRRGATCLACSTPVPLEYVRAEGQAGRMDAQLMAIVAEGQRTRVYLPPSPQQVETTKGLQPPFTPETTLSTHPQYMGTPRYGMIYHHHLFTSRQLIALTIFSDLVGEAHAQVQHDAGAAGLRQDNAPFREGGKGAAAYSDAIGSYLGLIASKTTAFHNVLSRWRAGEGKSAPAFGRQALAMVWDFAEVNPFAGAGGDFAGVVDGAAKALLAFPAQRQASVSQIDAITLTNEQQHVICTDPPYFDNIGYANLSDFFYIWLRRSLSNLYPDLFNTLLTPKSQELIADSHRFGGNKEQATDFFEQGLHMAFKKIRRIAHLNFPLTVFYAFKQVESDSDDEAENSEVITSTGWETILEGLIQAGFIITGTWPIRTEMGSRMRGQASNALATSIVLVCRPRAEDAPLATRREFLGAVQRELPAALKELQRSNIAPVDLAQASIGPGMAIYSRYGRVLEADGSPLRVRTALALINQALDAFLAEQEGEYDPDTRWALAWFDQYAHDDAPFGDAETLSKAKNTSVQGMVEAGILHARAGKVRLLRRDELPTDWNPQTDLRVTIWEATQHLIHSLQTKGEQATAQLLADLGPRGDPARDLAYRLYTLCERKGWAAEATAYNTLVVAWSDVGRMAHAHARGEGASQGRFEM